MIQKKYWKKIDRPILTITLGLMVFGIVAVSSASAVLSFERFGHNNYYLYRQLIFVAAALVIMFAMSQIDYHLWEKWSKPILLLGLVLLALVLVPGLGFKPSTARSWFKVGDFLLQPSEFAKLAVIFYLSSWFERKKEAEKNFWFGIMPPLLVIGAALILVVVEPDLGTAAIIGVIVLGILFAAGVKLKYLGGLLASALLALWILIKAAPYRAARIITFLDPSLDPRGIGYHINQALLAIGAGGFWGYGFGRSLQKHNYLPEPIGDSIFAVIAEELGFLRVSLVVMLFAIFALRALKLSRRAPDKFGYLLGVGITSWIGLQALINIGAITGLLPLTGIPLPFLSYGGSSLLVSAAAVGVLLNIGKQGV